MWDICGFIIPIIDGAPTFAPLTNLKNNTMVVVARARSHWAHNYKSPGKLTEKFLVKAYYWKFLKIRKPIDSGTNGH